MRRVVFISLVSIFALFASVVQPTLRSATRHPDRRIAIAIDPSNWITGIQSRPTFETFLGRKASSDDECRSGRLYLFARSTARLNLSDGPCIELDFEIGPRPAGQSAPAIHDARAPPA